MPGYQRSRSAAAALAATLLAACRSAPLSIAAYWGTVLLCLNPQWAAVAAPLTLCCTPVLQAASC